MDYYRLYQATFNHRTRANGGYNLDSLRRFAVRNGLAGPDEVAIMQRKNIEILIQSNKLISNQMQRAAARARARTVAPPAPRRLTSRARSHNIMGNTNRTLDF